MSEPESAVSMLLAICRLAPQSKAVIRKDAEAVLHESFRQPSRLRNKSVLLNMASLPDAKIMLWKVRFIDQGRV